MFEKKKKRRKNENQFTNKKLNQIKLVLKLNKEMKRKMKGNEWMRVNETGGSQSPATKNSKNNKE